jgi:hypothetical protein
MMISDVLPTDKRQKGSLKKLASVLLGFDPGNPETILTVVISLAAAVLFPVKEENGNES